MEKKPPRPMTPFDELVIPQHLHMLKLMLPYTPSSNQHFLGVFIKFLELKETLAFFQRSGNDLHTQAFSSGQPPSPMEMLGELKPYMPPQEAEMMDTFLNMMNIMEMVQMFQGSGGGSSENPFADMMGAFTSGNDAAREKENSPENGFPDIGAMANMFSGGASPIDMMMGMLTPEQRDMFQMYNHMFANDMDANDMDANDMDAPEDKDTQNTTDVCNTDRDAHETDNPKVENSDMEGDRIYERMDEQSGNEKYRPS